MLNHPRLCHCQKHEPLVASLCVNGLLCWLYHNLIIQHIVIRHIANTESRSPKVIKFIFYNIINDREAKKTYEILHKNQPKQHKNALWEGYSNQLLSRRFLGNPLLLLCVCMCVHLQKPVRNFYSKIFDLCLIYHI